MNITLHLKDDQGNQINKKIKIPKQYKKAAEFLLHTFGIKPELIYLIGKRMILMLEQEFGMSYHDITNRCKNDEAFKAKVNETWHSIISS